MSAAQKICSDAHRADANRLQNQSNEPEADLELRRWERKSSETALHESHRELELQTLQLHQAHQWVIDAQREKIKLCRELELKNRIYHESRTRCCQEIEEMRRICCEETDRVRHLRINE